MTVSAAQSIESDDGWLTADEAKQLLDDESDALRRQQVDPRRNETSTPKNRFVYKINENLVDSSEDIENDLYVSEDDNDVTDNNADVIAAAADVQAAAGVNGKSWWGVLGFASDLKTDAPTSGNGVVDDAVKDVIRPVAADVPGKERNIDNAADYLGFDYQADDQWGWPPFFNVRKISTFKNMVTGLHLSIFIVTGYM